jgi:uncharacterized SAM-dependent methyltransferase
MTMPFGRCGAPGTAPRTNTETLAREVMRGLKSNPKMLPPKLFYDTVGAALFEQICELPEYYLTRAELEILRARSDAIAELAGPGSSLIEYGSGSGVKIRLLLDALQSPAAYVPIDISREQLARVNRELDADFDLDRFAHRAFFNSKASRVEMHLVSLAAQTVEVAGESIRVGEGETIWTESSYKYDRARLEELTESAGFQLERLWTDSRKQFWVAYLAAV